MFFRHGLLARDRGDPQEGRWAPIRVNALKCVPVQALGSARGRSFRLPNLLDEVFKGRPIGHRAVGPVGLAGGADGGVEVGPLLRLISSLREMTDGVEAASRGSLL